MPVQLYFDVHVDKAIHDQLHLRGVAKATDPPEWVSVIQHLPY